MGSRPGITIKMSSRAFRRLQKDVIKVPVAGRQEDDEEEKAEPMEVLLQPQKKKKQIFNPFELLEDNGDISDGEGEEEREEQGEQGEVLLTPPTGAECVERKKKRKKKKKKPREDVDDEVEVAMKQVNEMLGSHGNKDTLPDKVLPSNKHILIVDRRHLNPLNEMKRIFGSRVVREDQSRRKDHKHSHHKPTLLATPKSTWPKMEKLGLTMILSEAKNNCQYFMLQHSVEYQRVQGRFWDAVETYDPNSIGLVLQAHPYHIDSLLQLSEVCKMGEDIQTAAELIERALYSFECSFHPMFNITQGNCRMCYSRTENRAFYLTLFKHLTYIGSRGCHRTSFEFCKLLLSLEPDQDPLGVLLMIDYYALRACQYQFILDLSNAWEATKNLSQLPNFAFSFPMALQCMSVGSKDEGEKRELESRADSLLQQALIMFPTVLLPLISKCGVTLPSSVTTHRHFTISTTSNTKALQLLIDLFVERNHSLWKEPEALIWLERNAISVTERYDTGDPLFKDYHDKRQRRYVGTPRNVYRHVILSDMESVTTSLPKDITGTPIMMYDPLPPLDSVSGYERPPRDTPTNSDDISNPLGLFFRSLLPSYTNLRTRIEELAPPNGRVPVEGVRPQQEQGAVGGATNEHGLALEAAVGQLTESINNLLQLLNIARPHQEGEGETGSDSESDST